MRRSRTAIVRWLVPTLLVSLAVVESVVAAVPDLAENDISPQATQTPVPSSRNGLELSAREQLYTELARRVDVIEANGRILRTAIELVRPSVVHIQAWKRIPDATGDAVRGESGMSEPNQETIEEAGAGALVVIHGRTVILTNRHVVQNADLDRIYLQLSDGRTIHATDRWSDEATDIAVLAVREQHLIPARLGNSDAAEVGDFVLAFGSPFGLNHSVTHGIISAKGRRDLILGDETVRIQDFIQTDAAINPGNSGGPLINLRGEVIGINTAIASNSGGNEGIGFSIPINLATAVATRLVRDGKLVRGFLGVQLDSQYGSDEASRLGLLPYPGTRISSVTSASPAEQAGIRPGDVVLSFDGHDVENDSHLINLVGMTPVDREIPMTIYREGERLSFRVLLRSRSEMR